MYVLCCYLVTLFRLWYFCYLCVLSPGCLVRLSVPVQVIDWKDLSPKWPIMCWRGCQTLLTHSLIHWLWPSILDLRSGTGQADRQTDNGHQCLMPPPYVQGHNSAGVLVLKNPSATVFLCVSSKMLLIRHSLGIDLYCVKWDVALLYHTITYATLC